MHEIITDPREWVLNWLEDRFQVTRQCLENSTCLANCTMFEVVDGMLMESTTHGLKAREFEVTQTHS